jgi:iron(III) transport system ATP-binding protein
MAECNTAAPPDTPGGTVPLAAPPALAVAGLAKSFGSLDVLRAVDLTVPTGSVTAVLGPSGGGKTTLLRIIAGFDEPDAGTVAIAGTTVASPGHALPPERRRVGVVPQEGALFPHLDVAGNVGFGLPRGAAGRAAGADRIAEVLELVGLPGLQRMRPHQLSGGQQHRVALARALAPRPALVLLDEPFSSLDAGLRAQVREEVLLALDASGTTAVVVTHDQQEALSIADQVAVLLDGRIAQTASPAALYDEPVSLAVATFVGDAIVLPGVASRGVATCALGHVALRADAPQDGPVNVVVRPEQLELRADNEDSPTSGAARGTVTSRSFFGLGEPGCSSAWRRRRVRSLRPRRMGPDHGQPRRSTSARVGGSAPGRDTVIAATATDNRSIVSTSCGSSRSAWPWPCSDDRMAPATESPAPIVSATATERPGTSMR